MSIPITDHIDLNQSEIRQALLHILGSDPGSPTQAQFWFNSTGTVMKYYDGSTAIAIGRMDKITPPGADVSWNSFKITNLAAPVSGADATNKTYVDNLIAGLSWKDEVRAATTAAGTLASSFENGDVVDGVTLATGDRILVKNQAAAAENGIYTVNASGAPTRATDADSDTDLRQAAVFVREGTTNQDTGWVLTNDGAITVGTTGLTFAQFTGGTVTAGSGLTSSGNTLNVGAGTGITVNADDVALTIPVALTSGGTGAITAQAARDNLVVPTTYAVLAGDGSSTTLTITHNLNTKKVRVVVRRVSDNAIIQCGLSAPTVNTVSLTFSAGNAPATNGIEVTVDGVSGS